MFFDIDQVTEYFMWAHRVQQSEIQRQESTGYELNLPMYQLQWKEFELKQTGRHLRSLMQKGRMNPSKDNALDLKTFFCFVWCSGNRETIQT
jgi:hypothetical protein